MWEKAIINVIFTSLSDIFSNYCPHKSSGGNGLKCHTCLFILSFSYGFRHVFRLKTAAPEDGDVVCRLGPSLFQ